MSKEISTLPNTLEMNIQIKPGNQQYRNYKAYPVSSQNTVLGQSSFDVVIQIPAGSLWNPSRTNLCFYRAETNQSAVVTTKYLSIIKNNFNYLSRVQVQTNNFKFLDLNYCAEFIKSSAGLHVKNLNSDCEGYLVPSIRVSNGTGIGQDPFSSPLFASTYINVPANNLTSAVGTADSATGKLPGEYINVNLGKLLNGTLFSIDRLIYISQNIEVKFTFNPINKIIFMHAASYASPENPPTLLTAAINNVYLNCYLENNDIVRETIMSKSSTLQELVLPQIISNAFTITGAGLKAVQNRINVGNYSQSRLNKIYSILQEENAGQILNTSNHTTDDYATIGKYKSVALYVNSQNILNLDCKFDDEIMHMSNQFDNSIIMNNRLLSKYYGMFCNVFSSDNENKNNIYIKGVEYDGLDYVNGQDITLALQYDIITNLTLTNFQFAEIRSKVYTKNGVFSTMPF